MRGGWGLGAGAVALAGVALAGCGNKEDKATLAQPQNGPVAQKVDLKIYSGKAGKLALASVRFDKKGPFGFIIDTGASKTIIDAAAAQQIGLRRSGKTSSATGASCGGKTTPVKATRWKLGTVDLPPTQAAITPLTLARGTKGKLAGLLGSDVLGRFDRLKLDYRGKQLVLGGPTAKGGKSAPLKVVSAKGEKLALVSIKLNGKGPYAFILDTGASTSTVDSRVASKVGLSSKGKPGQIKGVSCSGKGTRTTISDWSAGSVKLPKAKAIVTKLALTGQTNGKLAGLLGSDVLSSYGKIAVDYTNQKLTLGAK